MKLSPAGLAFLSHEEGFRTHPYEDQAGKETIGCGHLLMDAERASGVLQINGIPVRYADGITPQQVQDLLAQDCQDRETAVSAMVVCPLSQHQFDAIMSLAYNIGLGALSRSQLLKILNGGDWTGLEEAWLAFKFAGGLPILLGRRQREWALWSTPDVA